MKRLIPIFLAVAAFTFATEAQDNASRVGLNTRWGYVTNATQLTNAPLGPIVIANGATTVTNGNTISVWRDRGIAFFADIVATNATATNVVFAFDVSADGTNFTTSAPLSWTATLAGVTTKQRLVKFFARTDVDNCRALKLSTMTGANTGNVFASNIVWSVFP